MMADLPKVKVRLTAGVQRRGFIEINGRDISHCVQSVIVEASCNSAIVTLRLMPAEIELEAEDAAIVARYVEKT